MIFRGKFFEYRTFAFFGTFKTVTTAVSDKNFIFMWVAYKRYCVIF